MPLLRHDLIPAAPGKPTVVVLHGLGDSKEGWKPVAQMLRLPGFGWCFVQAPIAYYDGWSWFDLDPQLHADPAQIRASRTLVDQLLDHLIAVRGIPAASIVLMGFSQGCLMTLDAGLRRAERFAGLVGISGWLAFADEYPAAFGAAARQQRIFWSHGDADPLIPLAPVIAQAERIRSLGVAVDWRVYAKEHGLDQDDELPELRAFLLAADGST
jgi:phospholipase/carboxylesterase